MKELLKRFRAGVPAFWRKVQRLCLAAGSVSVAIYGFAYADKLPAYFFEVAKFGAALGFFGSFLAQLTVSDKPAENGK